MRCSLAVAACLPLLAASSCARAHVSSSTMYARGKAARASAAPDVARDAIAGFVVDEQGQPVRARVAAVSASGALSVTADRAGRFELAGLAWKEFTVQASADDRFAIEPRVVPGTGGIRLELKPAAAVTVEIAGTKPFRCAVLQGDVHVDDVTVRPGESARIVVPPGEILVQLYDAGGVREERTAHVAVGEHRVLALGASKGAAGPGP